MHGRQLQERAHRTAIAAEHAQCLEQEMQQHEAAHARQMQQKLRVCFSSRVLAVYARLGMQSCHA
jgi:hypothetical protein